MGLADRGPAGGRADLVEPKTKTIAARKQMSKNATTFKLALKISTSAAASNDKEWKSGQKRRASAPQVKDFPVSYDIPTYEEASEEQKRNMYYRAWSGQSARVKLQNEYLRAHLNKGGKKEVLEEVGKEAIEEILATDPRKQAPSRSSVPVATLEQLQGMGLDQKKIEGLVSAGLIRLAEK